MADEELDEIHHRWGQRALSTGRIAASAVRLAGRRLVGAEGDADRLLGERLARELDGMKGLAMKVGQILSYFDGVLPAETHEALRKLQKGARPVAFETMRQEIEEAFGEPVSALFEAFDDTPVAAASIGQVYRARFERREVAVKVQYPHVEKTFEADFGRIRSLARLASLATAVDGVAIADELRARVTEECDYLREAAWQAAFRAAFADDPRIVIPEVVQARTRRTVLTTAWAAGDDFYAFVEGAPAARRHEVGLLLARFALRSLFGLGTLNADPHPGNYLFPRDEGHVVFLDFGCVRRFEPDFLETERALVDVVIHDRRAAFRDAVMATGMIPQPRKFDFDVHWDMLRHQYAPYGQPRFRFTPEYVQAGAKFSGPSNPNLRRLAIPPAWIWVQRLLWGLHAVQVRLGAEGAFRDVMEEALATRLPPLAVPA